MSEAVNTKATNNIKYFMKLMKLTIVGIKNINTVHNRDLWYKRKTTQEFHHLFGEGQMLRPSPALALRVIWTKQSALDTGWTSSETYSKMRSNGQLSSKLCRFSYWTFFWKSTVSGK